MSRVSPGARGNQVAEWMSEHGGTVTECARAIGVEASVVKHAWRVVRMKLGREQCQ